MWWSTLRRRRSGGRSGTRGSRLARQLLTCGCWCDGTRGKACGANSCRCTMQGAHNEMLQSQPTALALHGRCVGSHEHHSKGLYTQRMSLPSSFVTCTTMFTSKTSSPADLSDAISSPALVSALGLMPETSMWSTCTRRETPYSASGLPSHTENENSFLPALYVVVSVVPSAAREWQRQPGLHSSCNHAARTDDVAMADGIHHVLRKRDRYWWAWRRRAGAP